MLLVFAKTPLALAAGPFAYVTDSGGYPYTSPGTVSVIDTSNNSVVATITVGTQPYGIAVTPGWIARLCGERGGTVLISAQFQ